MRRARWLSILAPPGAILALLAGATGSAPASAQTAAPQASALSCSQSHLPLPDPVCTPGVTNPDVRQDTIGSTICVSGWVETVRPPTSYTDLLKAQQIGEYGYADTRLASYEEDHLIPLELGGSPRDPKNLWPEPRNAPTGETASSKDTVENQLKSMVCAGTAGLVAAQQAIATDWRTAVAFASGSGNRVVAGAVPRPDHVFVVVIENHVYGDIIGSSTAPYINSLASRRATFTASTAITHPDEPTT